ncbi:MAG: preprotein translocase subunit SecE [Defluviitaleaceae bacterium]|nr:preprotein translocase subunit SecE [Defluviitaleaceae bacterium]
MADKPETKELKKKNTISDFKGEFKQIKWPTKKELRKQVVTVIITCIIVTVMIFIMDYTISFALDGVGRAVGIEEFNIMNMFDFGDFNFDDMIFDEADFGDDMGIEIIDLEELPYEYDIEDIDLIETEELEEELPGDGE